MTLLHYFTRFLIIAQRYKLRMTQMVAPGPLGKLDLSYKLWTQPLNLLHYLCRNRFTASGARTLGQIRKGTFRRSEFWEVPGHLASQHGCKTISDLRDEDQVLAFVITDKQILESVSARFITADYKFLTLPGFELDPRTAPLTALISTVGAFCDDAFEPCFPGCRDQTLRRCVNNFRVTDRIPHLFQHVIFQQRPALNERQLAHVFRAKRN